MNPVDHPHGGGEGRWYINRVKAQNRFYSLALFLRIGNLQHRLCRVRQEVFSQQADLGS